MSKKKIYIISSIVIILVVLFSCGLLIKKGPDKNDGPTFMVNRGPLTISFIESGTIKARDQIIIKNEVEGRTSIISLIPEGTRVKKGDLLVELDASVLVDMKLDQEIMVQNAEAAFVTASETLAVIQNQAKSDVDLAKLNLTFATQDRDKYIQGEYPYSLTKADADITLAQQQFTQAEKTLIDSNELYKEKFISQTEWEKDKLAKEKSALDVQLAQKSKELLTDYTYKRTLAQLDSNVAQAEMALERVERKAKADVVQAQADLKAKDSEFQRQKDKLQKIEDQIKKTKIYAPADGLAIYATSARQGGGFHNRVEPLDEGQEVQERQELIYLPIGNLLTAEIEIHESNLDKTKIGQPAIITADALQDSTFYGTLAQIAPLPDAQSMFMNPDLKVYNSAIFIDGTNELLRTGMGCQAEVIVQRYTDAIFVPLQAVIRVGSDPTVYVKEGDAFVARKIQTGLDNNKVINVIDGLKDGDIVLLNPPLKPASVQNRDPNDPNDQSDEHKMQQKISNNLNGSDTDRPDNKPHAGSDDTKGQRRKQFENLDPQQREEMKKRFQQMTPEQREKLRSERNPDTN